MKTPREVVLLSTSSSIPKPGNRLWILIREASSYFLPFALAMATVVGFLRWHVESSYREEILSWQVRLSGVADNNAESVSEWLKERLADTRVLSASPVIRSVLRAESKGGQLSKSSFASEPDPLFVLEEIATSYSYSGVYILDRDVRVVMQSRGSIPFNTLWTESCRAVDRSGVARVDLIGDSPSRTVVGSIAPVFLGPAAADNGPPPPGQLLGSVLLVSDASKTLVPLLKREALPTRTGETILIRREGNEIVFFSPLRHTPANAPSPRFPLAAAPLPARYAVEGRAAFVQFNDYRGVPVLAATRNIPLTGWGLVRKIDRAEALEEFNHGKLLEELAAGLIILLLGGVLIVSRRYIIAREQDRTEKELRRLNRALRTMSECSLVLVKAEDELNLLNQLCETVVRVGGYRMAWVGFPERDEGKSVRPVAQAGFEDGYLQTANITWADTARGNGPMGSAIRTGKPVVAQDILSDPSLAPWREEAQKRGYASCISLPLIAQGQVLGALTIDAGEPDAFDSDEVALLTRLVDDLAYGIQSLRAKAERERAEEALRNERAFTESIIDSLPDSFFILDSTGGYVRWNRNAGKALGYSAEEFAALDPLAHVAEDDRPLAARKMQEALTKGSATADYHLVAKDGRKVPYLLTATRVVIHDKAYLIGIAVDITERKRAENELYQSRQLLQSILDTIPERVFWKDRNSVYLGCNKALAIDAGLEDPAEIMGKPDHDLVWRETAEAYRADDKLVMEQDTPRLNYEETQNRPDGRVIWLRTSKLPLHDREGKVIGIIGTYEDITERKRTEDALIEERHLLHSLMDNLPDRIFFKDRESRFTRINKVHADEFGLSDPAQAAGKTDFEFLPAERAQRAANDEKEIIRTGQPIVGREGKVDWPDGHVSWFVTTKMPLRDASGNIIGTFGISHDITDRKRAENAIFESEGKYRSLVSNIPDVVWTLDANLRFVFISRNIERISGFSADEVDHIGADLYLASLHTDDVFKVKDGLRALFAEGRPYDVECRVRRKNGEWIWIHDRAVSTYEKSGIRYADGLLSDITERKRTEEALQQSEALLNETGRLAKVGGWELHLLTHKLTWTKEVFRIHEVDESFVPTLERGIEFYAPESRPVIQRALDRASEHGEAFDLELELVTARGKRLSVRAIGGKQARHDGTFVVAGTFQDVTERNLAESALRASEVRYRRLFEAAQDGILILDADSGEIRDVNPFLTDLLGFSQAELLGKKLWEIGPLRDVLLSRVSFEELQTRGYVRYEDLPLETRDGKQIAVEFVSNVYLADDKRVIQCNIRDITARKEAEEEHVRLVTAIEQSAEAVVITNPAGNIEYVNSAFTHVTGYSREEVLGKNPRILKSGKQDPEFYKQLWETIVNGQTWEGELINRRKNGSHYTEQMSITAVRDRAGMATHFIATKQDITERRNLEAQLHQTSKMQAVGQLAGGVAHDFNNLLTVINGYSEILMERLASDTKTSGYLEEIHKAGERAASLTRQLLAFSRHQVLAPKVLDMNDVVSNLGNMLRRLIGEDIKLRTLLSPSLARVKADPGQIEQVIINLAVNARDAMPKGGNLTIETSNVELDEEYARIHPTVKPGPHAVLVVSDTGEGMTPETQSRIFEPFFTTKEMGKGTGLGLATVYGIVKQSGGSVWVYSEVGKGTTFKIYFPVVSDGSEAKESPKLEADSASGTETVLVVEDEEGVRLLVRLALVSKGYKVLEAPDPKSALAICSSHDGPINLLLTDVVMPQMSGPEVASKVAALRPSIRVLYMSGYTDDTVVHHGVLSQEMSFIQKPFSNANLRKKIREVLDGTKGRGSGAGQARD